MILERSKNTKRNILWGTVNKIILLILPFIIRTIIIRELGIEYIGLNSLFTSILSILSLTELGFDSAVVFIMYNGVANDDQQQLNALLAFIKKAYLIIGTIILILGLFCVPFLPHLISDASSLPPDINIYHIYLVFLFSTVASYYFGGYRNSLVVAYQRNDVISNINTITRVFFFGLQIFILKQYHDYYYYIYTLLVCNIIINLVVLYTSRRMFPNVKPEGYISKEDKAQLKKLVFGAFIQKVGAMLTVTLDSIVISSFIGVKTLGYYSNYSYIITSIIGFLYIIYTSMQGGLGNSVILDSVEKNYKDMLKFNFIYAWLIGWCLYCCLFLFQPFIKLWIGEVGILPDIVMILLCLFMYQSECFGIVGSYKAALGIVWEDRYRPLFSGGFKLILSIILVLVFKNSNDEYALAGIVLSSVLAYALINCPWITIVLFRKYFKTGLKELYFKTYKYFACAIFAVLLSYPLFYIIPECEGTRGLFYLLLRGLLCMVLPNVLFVAFYHRTEEYKQAMVFIVSRIRK